MIYLASLDEGIDDKLNRYTILHTREEVSEVIVNSQVANTIIFRDNFVSKYFTPSGFAEFCNNIKKVNPNIIIKSEENKTPIDWDWVMNKLNLAGTIDELYTLMSYYPKEVFDTIKFLVSNQADYRDKFLEYSSQISELQDRVNSLNDEKEEINQQLTLEQLTKQSVDNRLQLLVSRINYQYGKNYNAEKTFEVSGHSFDKIIYIKEITRVQYVDTLIYNLKEILKILYGMPTRLCVIEGYYADSKTMLYPNLKPHYALTHEDILSGDILMLGMQKKIMGDILKNASNISFLIVLDRAGYSEPHIRGDNIEYLFTASDVKDVPDYIDKSRIISYDPTTLNIPYIEGFDELDNSNRMTLYSSFPIMKTIVSILNLGGK